MIDLVVAALNEYVDYLLYQCLATMYDSWQKSSEGFNPGQIIIYINHIMSGLYDAEQDLAEQWPWTDVEVYFAAVEQSYDMEVMNRAFTESIDRPMDKMQEIISQAQQAQALAEMLEAVDKFLGG